MLRRIGLSNFKCWKELDIELAPITLLFGANSSGKSAILQSLLMLKQTAQGFDPGQHINFGGSARDYVDLGSYLDLVHVHDMCGHLAMQLAWDTNSIIFFVSDDLDDNKRQLKSMNYDVAWGIDDNIFVSKLRYDVVSRESEAEWVEVWRGDSNQYFLTSSFTETGDKPDKVASPERCHVLPWTAHYGSEKEHFVSLMNVNGEFERIVEKFQYIGPMRRRPKRHYVWTGGKPEIIDPEGENTVQALVASARADRSLLNHVTRLLQEMDLVESFDIRPIDENQRLYEATATIGGVKSSLVDVGFGVSQILPVATMVLSAPHGSIILLEQPELHLHPSAQAALADLVLEVAETRNLQLIVESHSEHIVRRLQRRIAEASPAFAKPENIKMYFCQPGEGGATIDEVVVDRFGQIVDWPEKFMGDISGDIHSMGKAAFKRLHRERVSV